jgi:flavin-dependent dehydrogenase
LMANNDHFDLAIIGGGPAGCSAAITAARSGTRVVLLEARDFPRHKVCGEFVSYEGIEVLTNLLRDRPGAGSKLDDAPKINRARLFLGTRMIEERISPGALSITRFDLDAKLWNAAQVSGVKACSNCEVSAVKGDGPFHLATSRGEYSAAALIVAAGRWSQFTPDRNAPSGSKWIGLKGHFRELSPPASTDLYFFEHGYCGVQPVAKDVVNACAVVRSDQATSPQEVFRLQPKLAERAAGWKAVTRSVSTAPLVYRPPEPVHGKMVFAGDAAAFIDPFVGDGISIALRSGQLAAQIIRKFLTGATSLSESVALYQKEYSRHFDPLLAAASQARRLLSLPAFARSAVFELLRIPGVMPFIIRKTRRVA